MLNGMNTQGHLRVLYLETQTNMFQVFSRCKYLKTGNHSTIKTLPWSFSEYLGLFCNRYMRGHCGRVVTLSPPTSEIGFRFPARLRVGKLVVAVGRQFTVQNHDQLYVQVSSALPTTSRDITCTVLKVT